MSDIKIEKNVPMPDRLPELPLAQMEVGDSCKVTIRDDRDRMAIAQRLLRYKQRNPPKNFSMRKVEEDAVRVYRVDDYET